MCLLKKVNKQEKFLEREFDMIDYIIDIPWNKYSIIIELSKKLTGISPQFGKTALQKMVFILQELFDVDCGYEYQFYTYGPFSSELLQDLDLVELYKGVTVEYNKTSDGYVISPSTDANYILEKGSDFLKKNKTKIDDAINKFGKYTARELELRSTIIYVNRYISKNGEGDIVNIVKELKPKFDKNIIQDVFKELKSDGFIKL